MAPTYGVVQEDIIYENGWCVKADKVFIDVLVDQQLIGNFNPDKYNEAAISNAMLAVNTMLNKTFTLSYCFQRLEILRKRHRVFSWLIRNHGVRYDVANNIVYAPDYVWHERIRWDDFTRAYTHMGDPDYARLCLLFNGNDEPYVKPIDVVTLSDDDMDVGLPNGAINVSGEALTPPNKKNDIDKLAFASRTRKRRQELNLRQLKARPSEIVVCDTSNNSITGSTSPSVNQPGKSVADSSKRSSKRKLFGGHKNSVGTAESFTPNETDVCWSKF